MGKKNMIAILHLKNSYWNLVLYELPKPIYAKWDILSHLVVLF